MGCRRNRGIGHGRLHGGAFGLRFSAHLLPYPRFCRLLGELGLVLCRDARMICALAAWYAALSTGGSMEGSQSTSRRRRNRRSSARHRVSHRFQEGSASASPDRHAQLGSQLRLQTPCRVSSELLSSQSTRPGRLAGRSSQPWRASLVVRDHPRRFTAR